MAVVRAPPSLFPPTEDTDAWLALVEQGNGFIVQHFRGAELPVEVETLIVDGITVYAARPHGIEENPDEPLYLDIHGGALLMGGGEACKLTTSMSALSTGMHTWGVDYRMPPLHPYPAALDDLITVYRSVLTDRDPSRLFVGG